MKSREIRNLEMKYGRLKRPYTLDRHERIIIVAAYIGLLICAVLIVAGATWRW